MMWMPSWRVPRQERKWLLTHNSAPQLSMPYVAYFNAVGRNSFSIGVSALENDVNVESKIKQEKLFDTNNKGDPIGRLCLFCGEYGSRTRDLLHAMHMY